MAWASRTLLAPPENSAPAATFSSTVIFGNGCTIWKVRARPSRAIWCGRLRVMSWPSKRTRPRLAGCTPVIMLISVVLPAPFGPIRPRISPCATEKLTPSTALSPPKRRDTSSSVEQRGHRCSSTAGETLPQQRQKSVRQKQHQDDDDEPERRGVDGEEIPPDELLERDQDQRADRRTEDRAEPAEQDHHQRLDREQDVEHVGRLDVIRPIGVDRARHADEHGGERERRGLVAVGVDAENVGGVLVLLDAAQAEAELAVLDQDGGRGAQQRQRQHGVEEELRLRRRPRCA